MRFHRLAQTCAFVVVLASAGPSATWAAPPSGLPEGLEELWSLTERGDRDGLSRRFRGWKRSGDRVQLESAIRAFRGFPVGGRESLTAWASDAPGDALPKILLASHELGQMWKARGSGRAVSITEKGRAGMRAHADAARRWAVEATRSEPDWGSAYGIRIQAGIATGDRDSVEAAFREAMAHTPASYEVWRSVTFGLQRRWGGAPGQLAGAAEAAQAHVAEEPRLVWLLGLADLDRASGLDDSSEALALAERALVHGENPNALTARGRYKGDLGDFEGGRADLHRAIELDPWEDQPYHRLAHLEWSAAAWTAFRKAAETANAIRPGTHYATLVEKAQLGIRQADRWAEHQARMCSDIPYTISHGLNLLYSHAISSTASVLGLFFLVHFVRRQRRSTPLSKRGMVDETVEELAVTTSAANPSQLDLSRVGRLLLQSYLWLMVLYHGAQYSSGISVAQTLSWAQWSDIPITAIALVGALAFAYRRKVGAESLWRLWTFAFPGWNLFFHFVIDGATLAEWTAWGFVHLLLLPIYTSVFFYGFRSSELWASESRARRVSSGIPVMPN